MIGSTRIQIKILIGFLLLCAFQLSGCDRSPPMEDPTEPPVSDALSEAETPAAPLADEAVVVDSGFYELVLWTPDFFDPYASSEASATLAAAYEQFEQRHPDVHIEVQTKAEFGTTNLQNYLRSARLVAPSVLPDVILMDTQQLWRVVDLGLIAPITDTEGIDLSDMYPFAVEAATYAGGLYGIPYTADVLHLAQRQNILSGEEPGQVATWAELLSAQQTYLFPAGGRNGQSSHSLLLQYVGAGGQLMESGELSDPEALVDVLNFLASGIQRGVIPRNVAEYSDQSAVWVVFESGESDVVDVSASRFLQERSSLGDVAYAPVPTQSGSLTTIGRVWALAVLSQEPEKRALALEFVEFMLEPEVQGAWNQQADRLPTQRSSFALWENPQPYYEFLQRLLEVAVSLPNGAEFANFSVQLQAAQLAVLNREMSPAEALSLLQPSP